MGVLAGWRGLGRFWAAVVVVLGIGAGVLQSLGPPVPATRMTSAPHVSPPAEPAVRAEAVRVGPPPTVVLRPGKAVPGPITDPDPAMMEAYPGSTTLMLPRISVDGRAPMSAYAAGFDPTSLRPKVALVVAGIGMSEAQSLDAIRNLPGGVTLAISAYAVDVSHLLERARMNQHEYLLSIPMEPQGYPANDPDDRFALMTRLPPEANLTRLRGFLARFTGYAGVTDAFGQMHGERLAGAADQMESVLEEVGRRGLLFVDARIGQPPLAHAWNRGADLVIDADPVDAAALDQRLDTLSHIALDKGSALGIVSLPRPVTLERVAAWTNRLASQGVALAPVSALVSAPVDPDAVAQEAGK